MLPALHTRPDLTKDHVQDAAMHTAQAYAHASSGGRGPTGRGDGEADDQCYLSVCNAIARLTGQIPERQAKEGRVNAGPIRLVLTDALSHLEHALDGTPSDALEDVHLISTDALQQLRIAYNLMTRMG